MAKKTREPAGQDRFVFLSYARVDQAYVKQLSQHLGAAGVAFWFDERLDFSQPWLAAIEGRIERCAALVVVVTNASKTSPWVERELLLAEQLRKPIFPLQLGGNRWWRLSDIQAIEIDGWRMPGPRFIEQIRQAVAATEGQRLSSPSLPDGISAIAECLEAGDPEGADQRTAALMASLAGGRPIATNAAAERLPDDLLQLLCWVYRSSGGMELRDRPFIVEDAFGAGRYGLSAANAATGRTLLLTRLVELSGC
jgi:hypothetical protein